MWCTCAYFIFSQTQIYILPLGNNIFDVLYNLYCLVACPIHLGVYTCEPIKMSFDKVATFCIYMGFCIWLWKVLRTVLKSFANCKYAQQPKKIQIFIVASSNKYLRNEYMSLLHASFRAPYIVFVFIIYFNTFAHHKIFSVFSLLCVYMATCILKCTSNTHILYHAFCCRRMLCSSARLPYRTPLSHLLN